MSDTITALQWSLATPFQRAILWIRHDWAFKAIITGSSIMLGAQIIRWYLNNLAIR